jgi:hypothetical protein
MRWDRNDTSVRVLPVRAGGSCMSVQAGFAASYWPALTFTFLCRVRHKHLATICQDQLGGKQ